VVVVVQVFIQPLLMFLVAMAFQAVAVAVKVEPLMLQAQRLLVEAEQVVTAEQTLVLEVMEEQRLLHLRLLQIIQEQVALVQV
jgi:hypothetical protein